MFDKNPYDEHIEELCEELRLTPAAAKQVSAFRHCAHHTSELEVMLISKVRAGQQVNLSTFGKSV